MNELTLTNLPGHLRIMDDLGIKPNYSQLARLYGIDRHTVAKIHKNKGTCPRKGRPKCSEWDEYEEVIKEKMNLGGANKRAVYNFLRNGHPEIKGTYSGFCDYLRRKDIRCKVSVTPHPLYETPPGKQIQADWKENLSIHLKDGTLVNFNVFSATLGYSREHVFLLSFTKTEEDFIRCTIETFRRLGGVTEIFKTDNMSAIVSVKGNKKTVHPRILQFFKDIGVDLKLCQIKTPQTKGKDENANKFMNWLVPYEGELNSIDELKTLIEETITAESNQQINTGTNMPPATLFAKEKEYLKPLCNDVLLDSYLQKHTTQLVDETMLVYYKGNRYSVPASCIGKTVKVYEIENHLYIYDNKKPITIHTISQNRINYNPEHYTEALIIRLKNTFGEDEIAQMAKENLERLNKL